MDIDRERLVQVFNFLQQLNAKSRVRKTAESQNINQLDCFKLAEWEGCKWIEFFAPDDSTGSDGELEPFVTIRRPELQKCPLPPKILDGWLLDGWQNPEEDVKKCEIIKNSARRSEKFSSSAARVKAIRAWKSARTKWAKTEKISRKAHDVFKKLHAIWMDLQREGDGIEILLGDGILSIPEKSVEFPVLFQRIVLDFSSKEPSFSFFSATSKPELNIQLLQEVASSNHKAIGEVRGELEKNPVTPLCGHETDEFLKGLVHKVFTLNGHFSKKPQKTDKSKILVTRGHVIWKQSRDRGLTSMLEAISSLLTDESIQCDIPMGLQRLVGVDPQVGIVEGNRSSADHDFKDILLTKPANEEQYIIADRLAKHQCVVVQGPPGTGKTHTIANLIGHLLSQGKSVLVTAEKAKALRVLREKIDPALQPVCLSNLHGEESAHEQLAKVAGEMIDRLTTIDPQSCISEAEALRAKRREILAQKEELQSGLRQSRLLEIQEIEFEGAQIRPIEASKWIKNESRYGWIPGPVLPGAACPLSQQEALWLDSSNAHLTIEEEIQLGIHQPCSSQLVSHADFNGLANRLAEADKNAIDDLSQWWNPGSESVCSALDLENLSNDLLRVVEMYFEISGWLKEVVFAGWSGGDRVEMWLELLGEAQKMADIAGESERLTLLHGPEIPANQNSAEQIRSIEEICSHLSNGRSLNFPTLLLRPSWKQVIKLCKVNGLEPSSHEHFRALLSFAKLRFGRERFVSLWGRIVEGSHGPQISNLADTPENTAISFAGIIKSHLDWMKLHWTDLDNRLQEIGFRWKDWLDNSSFCPGRFGEMDKIFKSLNADFFHLLQARINKLLQSEITKGLDGQKVYLQSFPNSESASNLLTSMIKWDDVGYGSAMEQIHRLESLLPTYEKRNLLISNVQKVAENWANALWSRKLIHDEARPLEPIQTAWRWIQLNQTLNDRANKSLQGIQEKINELDSEARSLASRIVEMETWGAQKARVDLESQQALQGYVKTMKKIGKGTGERAAGFIKEALENLSKARHAIPVWIMPLNTVYESFDPKTTKFDVVIVDEASQADICALAALFLGKEIVIVGDEEQVTPQGVGVNSQNTKYLAELLLQGIPNAHLFDLETSIYALAQTAFAGGVQLREHFRCVPEIIQFCNELSYDRKMLPLREPSLADTKPPLVAHRVEGTRDGDQNFSEAKEIASLVKAFMELKADSGSDSPTTYGIIPLINKDDQRKCIEEHLGIIIPLDLLEKHRVLCGNASNFQGDERDVVFLSTVAGIPKKDKHVIVTGKGDGEKKKYNVAVSRARDQLWVVHSFDPEKHLKPNDLRCRLLKHVNNPEALMKLCQPQVSTTSDFAQSVAQHLESAGFRIERNWSVGAFCLPIVVVGDRGRLAVECDGESWFSEKELDQDIKRQAILERLGWVFCRVGANLFFREPEKAMFPILKKLDAMRISSSDESPLYKSSQDNEFIERVKIRAHEIRYKYFGN
jgi:very-short-patch-repair endonuclease/signal recognition particle GTPase